MWKRSIGIGLIAFAVLGGIIPARNIWTIWQIWHNSTAMFGIEFSSDPNAAEFLNSAWRENGLTLIAFSLIAVFGIIIIAGPSLRGRIGDNSFAKETE